MSQITPAGALNATALLVPDVYVQILTPQAASLNGVPTNVYGIVGVASWGALNTPITIATGNDIASKLGAVGNRQFDAATACAVAIQNGANNMRVIRVSDGTDTKASVALTDTAGTPATGLTLTARFSGILGNTLTANFTAGSKASTVRLVLQMGGQNPEIYDNISTAGTNAQTWAAVAAAITSGNSPFRGPSQIVTAGVPSSTAVAPLTGKVWSAAGGTDGATATDSKLVGIDGGLGTRSGMYCLRGLGVSLMTLVDASKTTWPAIDAFATAEGIYALQAGASGQATNIAGAVADKAASGIDSPATKILLGDYCYWLDTTNGVQRLLSPALFYAGLLANTAPQNSGLNKRVAGIVATEATFANLTYSNADLQTLVQAGIDVITNPVPGGNYFGPRIGHNSSSNQAIQQDTYPRLTNYIAATLAAGMGKFVGQNQSTDPTDPVRANVKTVISSFLQNMKDAKQIDTFSVQCDLTNNPPDRIGLGYLQVDVMVRYLGVVEKLVVNLTGGQTVTVARVNTQQ